MLIDFFYGIGFRKLVHKEAWLEKLHLSALNLYKITIDILFLKYFRYITISLSTEIKQNKINTKQFSHS
jgi:hypothetical protein